MTTTSTWHRSPFRLPRALGVALCCAALGLGGGCGSPISGPPGDPPEEDPVPPSDPPAQRVVYVVSHPDSLNGSEKSIGQRAAEISGLDVVLVDEHEFVPADLEDCALVLISKNVDDNVLGAGAKSAECGILFWEENQQQLRMLATMDNDGSQGTVWHTRGREVHVRPEAPAELTAGLEGIIDFFDRVDELSFGRRDQIPESAIIVAEYKQPGDHKVIYAFERGALLADGTLAAGRRVYFGLYRDNFHYLTEEASLLFDAALRWALAR